MEHSLTGDFSKDFKKGPSHGELLCSEALQKATRQNPLSSEASEIPAIWKNTYPLFLYPEDVKESKSGCQLELQ
jgi:hypothetical protein